MPGAGSTSTRRSEAVVSVPVLSTQIVSTEASDSTAFSCCDSAPARAMRSAAGGIRHRDQEDEALGDQRHHPGDGGIDRIVDPDVLLAEGDDQHDSERHHHREKDVEEPIDRALERRPGVPELAGGPREPLGVALGADRRDLERPGALDDERPRPHLLALRPFHGCRLAGEDRFVEPEAGTREQEPVGDDLIAGCQSDEISLHHLGDMEQPRLAVPDDRRLRRHERGQRVELLLGPELLPDSDPGVRDDDPEEEGVSPVPEGQREQAERDQDRVERRQRVRPDDRPGRAARRRLARFAAGCSSRRCLRFGQA